MTAVYVILSCLEMNRNYQRGLGGLIFETTYFKLEICSKITNNDFQNSNFSMIPISLWWKDANFPAFLNGSSLIELSISSTWKIITLDL